MSSIRKSASIALLTSAFASVIVLATPSASPGTEISGTGSSPLDWTFHPSVAVPHGDVFGPRSDERTTILVAVNVSQQQLDDLAQLGKTIEKKDHLAKELRLRQGGSAGKFGFDVGMGSAKGQTLPGPGKDRIGDALSAGERSGFDVAVKYSLERNNNLALAKLGAAIAQQDPEVQEARTADRDVFYWLGFDIATAIYGDPALGAQGNTATGPGAFKIRDALSPAAQRGFNDSVAFHLARTY